MKVFIMIYILIGFAVDVVFVIGSIYLKKDEILSLKKSGKNIYLIFTLALIELLFIWPYAIFIYKPKSDTETPKED